MNNKTFLLSIFLVTGYAAHGMQENAELKKLREKLPALKALYQKDFQLMQEHRRKLIVATLGAAAFWAVAYKAHTYNYHTISIAAALVSFGGMVVMNHEYEAYQKYDMYFLWDLEACEKHEKEIRDLESRLNSKEAFLKNLENFRKNAHDPKDLLKK